MNETIAAAWGALALGLMAAVSPCPLATNIAAVSFIGRDAGHPRRVFLGGFAYALGRTVVYAALGALVVSGLTAVPKLAAFLQTHMNRALGPLLVLTAVLLLELVKVNLPGMAVDQATAERAAKRGMAGAFGIGLLFALAFCPVTAALFFGNLIPLALANGSALLFPALFGVATALPVVAFAVVIAWGAGSLGRIFQAVTKVEKALRVATGGIFLAVGAYYILMYNLGWI